MENATTQQPRFLADAEGKYEVILTATLEGGAKASSDFKVYANRYVGVDNCATCHSGNVMKDKVTEWRETGHGTKFEDTFGSYSKASDYCVGCHVTGYNESDKAGGFDDAARLAGWTPEKGSIADWIKEQQKMTIDDVKKSPMGKLINIQCEACHGPGSAHAGILESVESGRIYDPGVCSQCHPQEARWRNSGHFNSGNRTIHMAEGASCVECHTAQGFIKVKTGGKKAVFPFQATADNPATLPEPGNMAPIGCATCHDPHAYKEPFNKGTDKAPNIASLQLRIEGKVTMPNGVTVDAKESALCVSCHADKRDLAYKADYLKGNKTRGAHDNTQADVFYGVTAAVFDFGKSNYATSPHAVIVEEGCIKCHMAASPEAPAGAKADGKTVLLYRGKNVLLGAGDHSWNMAATYQGKEIENVAICATCHKDLKE
ncbi:MAG: multiheme c-type cytochrome, partial [Chloroflexota bacterium]